jgi:protein-tyrosine phosphatase
LRSGREASRIGPVQVIRRSSGRPLAVALVLLGAACDVMGGRSVVGDVTLGREAAGGAGTGSAGTTGAAGPSPSGAAGTSAVEACGAPNGDVCEPSEPIITCNVANARDLGGMPLGTESSVACGLLFRGPPLARLSPPACAEAKRLGIRTIIDLRVTEERLSKPDDPCVGADMVLAPLPIPYRVSGENYIADFDTKDSMARIFRTLADPASYPVYFHCTYGRDRTGVVAAAILLALGASRADILAEYSLSKTTVGAYPDSLIALMNEIDRRGGIDQALRAAGVTDSDLAALRAQVVLQ